MRLIPRLLAFLVTAAALATGLVALTPSTSQAAAWVNVDKHCVTVAAGSACAQVQREGSKSYRYVVSVSPKSGKWITPLSATEFTQASGSGDDLCSSGCGRKAKSWSKVAWTCSGQCTPMALGFTYKTSAGTATVYAGHSTWYTWKRTCKTVAAGQVCLALADQAYRNVWKVRATTTLTPKKGQWFAPLQVKAAESTKKVFSRATKLCGCKKTQAFSASTVVTVAKGGTFHYMRGVVNFRTPAGTSSYTVTYR